MQAQEYWLPFADQEQAEKIRPAQFVHEGNDSDFVSGFISEVLDYGYLICLFDPIDTSALPITADVKHESLERDEMAARLEAALKLNPRMREHWIRAINGETVER